MLNKVATYSKINAGHIPILQLFKILQNFEITLLKITGFSLYIIEISV